MFEWLASSVLSVAKKTVVSAALGALVGGGISALKGNGFEAGAKRGAVVGGLSGAAMGVYGEMTGGPQAPQAPGSQLTDTPSQVANSGAAGSSGAPPPQQGGGLLDKWNSMTPAQGELLGSALAGGAQGYMGLLASEEAAKQAAANRDFEREKMENQNNQFFVRNTSNDWKQHVMDRRLSQGSA